MYRLLIVDDEPIIADGLVQLFEDYEKYEFDICKTYSAYDALDILKRTRIDILLLDIRMPGMNGLQLADQVTLYWPLCKIVFLTGYNEFDYVYTAIKKPDVNYVLKTEGDDAIVDAVENAVKKIIKETEQRNIIEKAKKQMDMIIPFLHKDLFDSLLNGHKFSAEYIKDKFHELGIKLRTSIPVLVLAGWVEYWPEDLSYPDKISMLGRSGDIFSEKLSGRVANEYIISESSRLIFFLQPEEKAYQFKDKNGNIDWPGLKAYLKAALEVVQNACKDLYGFDISFVLARNAAQWDNISEEFLMLKNIIEKRSLSGNQRLIDLELPNELLNIDQKPLSMSTTEFSLKLKLLDEYLDKGMDHNVEKICREILTSLKEGLMENYLVNIERYYSFLVAFISYINKGSINKKLKEIMDIEKLLMMDLPIKWNKAETFFVGLGRYICMLRKEQKQSENNIVISRIHSYINDNLSGDLSLTRLAEVVYLNPSYLSRFYKQVTGQNLSEYINNTRLEASRQMLKDNRMKINEIASKIGFEAPSCFTAFFKKMSSMTPQEYRDSLIKTDQR